MVEESERLSSAEIASRASRRSLLARKQMELSFFMLFPFIKILKVFAALICIYHTFWFRIDDRLFYDIEIMDDI